MTSQDRPILIQHREVAHKDAVKNITRIKRVARKDRDGHMRVINHR